MFSIPFTRVFVRLRLTSDVRFHFEHGAVIQGLVRRVFGSHELPETTIVFAPESGQVHYVSGDAYQFVVTLAGGAATEAGRFINGLQRRSAWANDPSLTLAGNFEVESAEILPPPDLERQVDSLAGRAAIELQFVSPFRLERSADAKQRGRSYVDAECFPASHFLLRVWQRLFAIEHGRFPSAMEVDELCPPIDDRCVAHPRTLLWVDMPIRGPRGGTNEPYTLGGVRGRVVFEQLPIEWLPPLVAGQYLHAGTSCHFGLGRYVIDGASSAVDKSLLRARSMLLRVSDPSLLRQSFEHLRVRSDASGIDDVTPAQFAVTAEGSVASIAQRVANGTWDPPPLRGFLSKKKSGGVRDLALPTVADRVVQRACATLLGESVDTLLEDCSYAYRKGFSRAGAARAIERAYERGYRWVLDGDIASFFDCVDWERLFGKLDALFPLEPLIALIRRWVEAPVVFDGKTIARSGGLPQGSPVAPLLANLFLDEFDEELLGEHFTIVRYADDFLILCRDPESAQEAKRAAQRALEHLGLSLREDKTAVRSLDDGFSYLGYLFCRSSVVPQAEEHASAAGPQEIAPHSWLAAIPMERVTELARTLDAGPVAIPVPVPLAQTKAFPDAKPLYVLTDGATLSIHRGRIVIHLPEGEEKEEPVAPLTHVVCTRGVRLTTPLLLELSRSGKPVFVCGHDGGLQAVLGPWTPDWVLWKAQSDFAAISESRIEFARAIVMAKLHNTANLVVRFKLTDAANVADKIRELEAAAGNKTDFDSLRGVEGKGAALFFEALGTSLAPQWQFAGRRRHPPSDPINAMLSYAYTILYNHCETALVACGLHPRGGLFHEPHGAHSALASDLQEEFRYIADAFVWALVRRGEIKPEDFTTVGGSGGGCYLGVQARRRFIEGFEQRLLTTFSPERDLVTTYRAYFDHQAARIRALIMRQLPRYEPLRSHA